MIRMILAAILLLTVSLLCFAGEESSAAPGRAKADVATPPSAAPQLQAADKPPPPTQRTMILTQRQADSLVAHGDSLMAEAGVKEVPVGAVSTTDLIYVLVVVLLVVVILRVAAG